MGRRKHWSSEEIKYLERSWGRVAVTTIARNLHRTTRAIKQKAQKLNLGGYLDAYGNITLGCLLKCLGYKTHNSAIRDKLRRDGFPVKKIRVISRSFYMVSIADFWQWADTHRDYFKYHEMEPLILGKEPEWVAEQRRIDFKCKYNMRRWSSADDSLLEYLVRKGYTAQNISARLNRSERAVGSRCYVLGIDNPHRVAAKKWNAAEQEMLMELYQHRYPVKYIAEQMGRSECSVSGRIKLLLSKETMNG